MSKKYLDLAGLSSYDQKIKEYIDDGDVTIDSTLTQAGQAADAKKVGDEISDVKSAITQEQTSYIPCESGTYQDADGKTKKTNVARIRNKLPISISDADTITIPAGYQAWIFRLSAGMTYIAEGPWSSNVIDLAAYKSAGARYLNMAIKKTGSESSDISADVNTVASGLVLTLTTKTLASTTSLLNKYSADTGWLNFSQYDSYGIKLIKNSDGSYTWSGTATQTVNSSRYQFAQTIGVTYHYKLNPSYDNTSSSYYFYVKGINGDATWNKSPEITWTATTSDTVSISIYCPTGTTVNATITPIINANYTNAELFGLISNNATDIQAVNELSTSGKVILIGASGITWESAGTVINYKNGELSSGNPNTFVATTLIDISKYGNLVLTFEGHTQGDSGIVFYDNNNNYINGVNPLSETTLPDMGYRIRIQVPSNASTCRIGASGTKAKELNIYISEQDLLNQLSKAADFRNTMFKGGIRAGSNVFPAFPMIPSNFETYAPIAYNALVDIMTANGYDTIPVYILSDSHGNAISPFSWLNEKDDTIKCLHLGDIANDTYNAYEMDVYGAWAKRINNIATLTGNHDVLYGTETMHEYDIVRNFVTTDRHMGGANNYYYVDDNNFRVRYIALDPYKIGDNGTSFTPIYQADQIAWLAETLEETKYDVVMLSHYPLCDSAKERDGTTFTSGPYATNQSAIQSIINAYQNKQSVSVTVDATTITADYTNAKNTILCAFSGHIHREGTGYQSGVRSYIAPNYQSESGWPSAFVAIDRKGGEVKVLKFDNSQNYTEWDLSMTE